MAWKLRDRNPFYDPHPSLQIRVSADDEVRDRVRHMIACPNSFVNDRSVVAEITDVLWDDMRNVVYHTIQKEGFRKLRS